MKPQTSPASFQTPASDSGLVFFCWGGEGCGKNDDDIVTPTPRTTISGRAILLGIYSTFVTAAILYSCLVAKLTSGLCYVVFLPLRGLSAKTRNWLGGKLFLLGL